MFIWQTSSPDETRQFGHLLGQLLTGNTIIALSGPLGAGKTFLTRAIAEGLDIPDSRVVTSPTFVLIQEYSARYPIYHFDVYRLTNQAEFIDLGVYEYFASDGVCIIEWADRVMEVLPTELLHIHIDTVHDQSRQFTCSAYGAKYEAILEQFQEQLKKIKK